MGLVKDQLRVLLTALPWDGVDVAELYFETPDGFDDVESLTPFSDWVRMDFASQHAMDPRDFFNTSSPNFRSDNPDAFDSFLTYRKELCLALNREVIQFVQGLEVGPLHTTPSVMLTLIDTVLDTAVGDAIGIDTRQFMALQHELDFDLNIEDPYTLWSQGPERYRMIASAYIDEISPGARLAVDINIVERGDTLVPHTQQTGLEFLSLLHEAASSGVLPCIYSATSPYPFDFEYASAALIGDSCTSRLDHPDAYKVEAPFTVLLQTSVGNREVQLDGESWPCAAPDAVLVPAGSHRVELGPVNEATHALHVVAMNGELGSCVYREGRVELTYDERRPVMVTLDRPVRTVLVDGAPMASPVADACDVSAIYLPKGKHVVAFAR
jgi:hypothetical protein